MQAIMLSASDVSGSEHRDVYELSVYELFSILAFFC